MQVVRATASSAVRQSDQYCFNVEGEFDRRVLVALLDRKVQVRPLGRADDMVAASRAMLQNHPNEYYIVDRDHRPDDLVERSWRDFVDGEKRNLLIWRKRTIENYFIDPAYLCHSRYVSNTERLVPRLVSLAAERLPMDVANLVIIEVRESLKGAWITTFGNPDELPDLAEARRRLLDRSDWTAKKRSDAQRLRRDRIADAFDAKAAELTGGAERPEPGVGRWLDLVDAKPILSQLVRSPAFDCRRYRDLSGFAPEADVAEELLKEAPNQPADFTALRAMVQRIIQRPG